MAIHAEDMRRYLSETIGKPVYLKINDNTQTMITVRPDPPGIRVSLHRMFLEADDKMLPQIAQFVRKSNPEIRAIIREYILNQQHRITAARALVSPRRSHFMRGNAKGRHFDLQERADVIHALYFKNALDFRHIMWSRAPRTDSRQRHVLLGTWNPQQRVIRIHPMLDMENIPPFLVDYVIFHEMVHIEIPSRHGDGRMEHHTPEFRAREAQYPYFKEALAWEKRWIGPMLDAWHGKKKLPPAAAKGPAVPPALAPKVLEPKPVSAPEPARQAEPPPPRPEEPTQLELF